MKNRLIIKSSCLLLCAIGLWSIMPNRAMAQDWKKWHYYADITVEPQADPTYDAVYADFSRLLSHDLHQDGALDENSIRVAPVVDGKAGDAVPMNFVKDNGFNETDNAAGTIVFLVAPSSKADEVTYRIFFDTKANGSKPAMKGEDDTPQPAGASNEGIGPVPDSANLIWNSSFEILSDGYTGSNRNYNSGPNMPRGWWGNLHGSKLTTNAAISAHTGEHAFGFLTPADSTNVGIMSAPTPPGIRVLPGLILSTFVLGEGRQSRFEISHLRVCLLV